jgi:hypothetical protein
MQNRPTKFCSLTLTNFEDYEETNSFSVLLYGTLPLTVTLNLVQPDETRHFLG